MTTTMDQITARPPSMTVTPVMDGDREVGAWIVGPDGVTYRPVVDIPLLAGTILATAGAAAIAAAAIYAAARHRPAIGTVTMGPGGWVSVKGTPKPALRSAGRPWWAHLLKAQPLTDTATARPRRRCHGRAVSAERGLSPLNRHGRSPAR